jgi:hypothetical protein
MRPEVNTREPINPIFDPRNPANPSGIGDHTGAAAERRILTRRELTPRLRSAPPLYQPLAKPRDEHGRFTASEGSSQRARHGESAPCGRIVSVRGCSADIGATRFVGCVAVVATVAGMFCLTGFAGVQVAVRSAPSGTSCGPLTLFEGRTADGKQSYGKTSVSAVHMSCAAADRVLLLGYQDGVDGDQLALLMPGWNCAADHLECDGPYVGAKSQSALGSTLKAASGPASGSTHGLVSVERPTAAVLQLLRLASRRVGVFPPAIFDSSILGPFNGRKCLPLAGAASQCFVWHTYLARLDDTEWAYGELWDKRGAGSTDNIHLWVRLIGGVWHEDMHGINVAPLTVSAPGGVLAAWHIHN